MQETKILIRPSIEFLNNPFKKNVENRTPEQISKATVTTFAGSGMPGLEDGQLSLAKFKSPLDIVIAQDDSIYVADGFNSCVRKIKDEGVITFAGNGNANIKDGIGTSARFKIPCRLAIDITDNLYLLDAADPRIRKITPAATVSTFAGTNKFGYRNGIANLAQFGQSFGITLDKEGNIYISDSQHDCIRKVSNRRVITIAGKNPDGYSNSSLSVVPFFFLKGLAIDKQGNLFVADFNRIRKITPSGVVSTFADTSFRKVPGQLSINAVFSQIEDMVIDQHDNIYFTEANRIFKIDPQGKIFLIAGSIAGYEDGDAKSAKFNEPRGLGIDSRGNLYVADSGNNRIRKISFN